MDLDGDVARPLFGPGSERHEGDALLGGETGRLDGRLAYVRLAVGDQQNAGDRFAAVREGRLPHGRADRRRLSLSRQRLVIGGIGFDRLHQAVGKRVHVHEPVAACRELL